MPKSAQNLPKIDGLYLPPVPDILERDPLQPGNMFAARIMHTIGNMHAAGIMHTANSFVPY